MREYQTVLQRSAGLFAAVLALILTAAGCSFLLSPLHGRENADDPRAQVYNLFAYQTGEKELTASFGWRRIPGQYDKEEEIDQVALVYSIGNPLPLMTIPQPPGKGGIKTFDYEDDQYSCSETIEDLPKGETVWFALYPHTEDGWLAPLYESCEVDDIVSLTVEGPDLLVPERGYFGDTFGALWELQNGDSYDIFGQDFPPERYIVLTFDLPARAYCTRAWLGLNTSVSETGYAYPVSFKHVQNTDGNNLFELVDSSTEAVFSFNATDGAGAGMADITEVVNRAILLESDTIVIRGDDTVNITSLIFDNDPTLPNSETLEIEYIQY